jgi:hypothetical protein
VLITLAFRLLTAPPSLKRLRHRDPEAADRLAERLVEDEHGERWEG